MQILQIFWTGDNLLVVPVASIEVKESKPQLSDALSVPPVTGPLGRHLVLEQFKSAPVLITQIFAKTIAKLGVPPVPT